MQVYPFNRPSYLKELNSSPTEIISAHLASVDKEEEEDF